MKARAINGKPLAVLRPSLPDLAVRLAEEAVAKSDEKAFENIPAEVEKAGGEYRFVGYLSQDGKHVLDERGHPVGSPKAGDSFVTFND